MKYLRSIFWKQTKRRKKNPLFQKHKKTRATYKKRKNYSLKIDASFLKQLRTLYALLWIWIIAALVYLFAFSDYFLIKNLKIQRQDNNSNIEIAYSTLNEYLKKNIFLLDVTTIKNDLFSSQENLWKIQVTKQFPKTLSLNLISYSPLYNTILKEKEYLILANGSAVPGNSIEFQKLDIKFWDFPRFYEYKKILNPDELAQIYEIEKLMKANFISTKIEKINYYVEEKEAHFITDNGATLIFDLVGNVKNQIKKLSVFHTENLQISDPTLIYTDLRISGKLYFCNSENEYNCYNNLNFLYGTER